MKKMVFNKVYSCILVFLFLGLTGCSKDGDKLMDNQTVEIPLSEEVTREKIAQTEEISTGNILQIKENQTSAVQEEMVEPIIEDMDWSNYFDGINGTAVIYEPIENRYQIYNQELALTQRSPCSTFKIISSLIALENGIMNPNESTRTWSGEIFWNEEWNRDIDFSEAFRVSCVWYFRNAEDFEKAKPLLKRAYNEA